MKVQTPLKKLRPKCKRARAKLPFQTARGTAHYQPPSQAHHGESVQNAMSRWCPENDSFYPEQDPIKLVISIRGHSALSFCFDFNGWCILHFLGTAKVYAECCCYDKPQQAQSYYVQFLKHNIKIYTCIYFTTTSLLHNFS